MKHKYINEKKAGTSAFNEKGIFPSNTFPSSRNLKEFSDSVVIVHLSMLISNVAFIEWKKRQIQDL